MVLTILRGYCCFLALAGFLTVPHMQNAYMLGAFTTATELLTIAPHFNLEPKKVSCARGRHGKTISWVEMHSVEHIPPQRHKDIRFQRCLTFFNKIHGIFPGKSVKMLQAPYLTFLKKVKKKKVSSDLFCMPPPSFMEISSAVFCIIFLTNKQINTRTGISLRR